MTKPAAWLLFLISLSIFLYIGHQIYFVPGEDVLSNCNYYEKGIQVFLSDCKYVFITFGILLNPFGWLASILLITSLYQLLKKRPQVTLVK